MNPFAYQRPEAPEAAVQAVAAAGAKFLAGGTNLIDLMKDGVERPTRLVDVNHVGLDKIDASAAGARIGAGVRNSDLANHPGIVANYPLLSHALLSGATQQLRNRATTGGNLLQRTRCYYFMDTAFPACNKRKPGSGCGALEGFNRIHAILGQTDEGARSPHTSIATNPSDMNVALYALNAQVEVMGAKGKRTIPVREFHVLPGQTPERDTVLGPDELITAVTLPAGRFGRNSWYLKARDRQSYAFALVSVAAGLEMDGGAIRSAGLALGGVAHKPWHSAEAEAALVGKPANRETFQRVAEVVVRGAKGYKDNAFKVEMAKSCVVRALTLAAQGSTQASAQGSALGVQA
ncbi:MAG TPA: xanthine dehydrogenase family protein subunit M [Acidobacteriaceae bacterium]|jgi:xanthine dehydrogenase YagS FAD-binding subunit|nr:xanthine dehydrogenase family protein subunit M [Acidobacteriaceae bacterium]